MDRKALSLRVFGVVQGVGFRPFVFRLARELGLDGSVVNSGGMVTIVAAGGEEAVGAFCRRLVGECPKGGAVTSLVPTLLDPASVPAGSGFSIGGSDEKEKGAPLLPVDLPICDDCLAELYNPVNRRYRHPFISCVACGPRYTIMSALPYDRPNTTMRAFPLCPSCAEEYEPESAGRRAYAQTVCCRDCGPVLRYRAKGLEAEGDEGLSLAKNVIKREGIVAVKAIGGYHFLCSPYSEKAVSRLRTLKGREAKPFAVMFPSLEALRSCADLSEEEISLLTSEARPIVLLERPLEASFAPGVLNGSDRLGAFLPYTPLQHLLLEEGPLVMTSANRSDEPVSISEEELVPFDVDGVLSNDREILLPLDDSVAAVLCGRPSLIRRSRGYVPTPIALPSSRLSREPEIFAAGGDLKACFSYSKDGLCYLSQAIGDLASPAVGASYAKNDAHMASLMGFRPEAVAYDPHPSYLSSAYALEKAKKLALPALPVFHHHAHAASVIAEHGLEGPVLGVVFDGTGYGPDGTVWGGEFLLCSPDGSFERVGSLRPIAMVGGDALSRDPSLSELCFRLAAFGGDGRGGDGRAETVAAALRTSTRTHLSSSTGRLFDAISSLLGVCRTSRYEGEAAILLEQRAREAERAGLSCPALPFPFEKGRLDPLPLVRALETARRETDPRALALAFHRALADASASLCAAIGKERGVSTVALSGGVFANGLLCRLLRTKLENAGFAVYQNERVPTNDGGLALGQTYVASRLLTVGCP